MSYTSRITTSLIALLSASSLPGQTAFAQSFTVPSGETRTDTQTMATDGDVGIVEPGGEISTTGIAAYGIHSTGINARIVQDGTISTTGIAAYGIYSDGTGARIVQNGTIGTTDIAAYGIVSDGAGARIVQNGTISTTGIAALGIYSSGAAAWITQNGTISTTGITAFGIYSDDAGVRIVQNGTIGTTGIAAYGIASQGAGARIVQNGTIETTGDDAYGIHSDGDAARIVQNGTIGTTGLAAYGILSTGDAARITQSGTIRTTGDDAYGIISFGADAWIANSGLIRATGAGAHAIRIEAGANTLTLLPGSRLEGTVHVDTAAAGSLTMNVEGGQSSVIQFVNAMPGTVNVSSDVAYAIDPAGLRVLTADVTMQQAAGDRFGGLIGATFGALGARGGAGSIGASPSGFAPLAYAATPDWPNAIFAGFDADPAAPAANAWVRGFGGMSAQPAPVAGRGHLYGLGGFAAGADTELWPGWTVGLFAGAGWGQARAGGDRLDDSTLLGGVYGQGVFGGTTLDVALALGGTYYDSARAVSTVGGMQTAVAGYGGLFIAPELGLTQRLDAWGQAVEVAGSVRYGALLLDGYTETGSLGNLSVDARSIHQFSARAQIAVPFETRHEDGGLTLVTPRLGMEATSQFGANTATGAIAGNAMTFSAGNGENLLGFAGLRFEHETAGSLAFSGDIEAVIGRNGSIGMQAGAGIKASF